eukprot:GHVT01066150.1.p1 GENE.GHVT01066150.1~~GHVT01066150.1.p1  ORF type:complete len:197 (+),score=30.91 GHVT01066150.1:923-1513(+)
MSSCVLSTLRHSSSAVGVVCLLASYLAGDILQRLPPSLLKLLVNVSWGGLFGAHLWVLLVQGFVLRSQLDKKQLVAVQSISFPLFFGVGGYLAGGLLISTVGLASTNTPLRLAASTGLLCCLLNNSFLVPKQVEVLENLTPLEEASKMTAGSDGADAAAAAGPEIARLRKRFRLYHGLSMGAAYLGLVSLLPYALL